MVDGQEADGWVAYGASANKYYASVDSEQQFIRFSDNKHNREKQWDIQSYNGETPPASMFDVPSNCEKRCPAYSGGCT
jgi:hypothetical protein